MHRKRGKIGENGKADVTCFIDLTLLFSFTYADWLPKSKKYFFGF
jgi:hypothetical protein